MRCEVLAARAEGLHVELHLDLGSVGKNILASLLLLCEGWYVMLIHV